MGIRCPLRKATQSLRFSSIVPACGNDWKTVFMIHKRELSDSMIESGSSLFYLFHCFAHDRLNTMPFRLFRNTPHGLHQQNRTDAMPQIHAICCELVDSFSDAAKAASALTIFPRFSTVKAIYIAIIDSLGRTIDRFLWCEHPVFFLLTSTSPDAHTGRCLWHLA